MDNYKCVAELVEMSLGCQNDVTALLSKVKMKKDLAVIVYEIFNFWYFKWKKK